MSDFNNDFDNAARQADVTTPLAARPQTLIHRSVNAAPTPETPIPTAAGRGFPAS